MLNYLKQAIEPLVGKLGIVASRTGLPPAAWTLIGLGLALLSGVLYASAVSPSTGISFSALAGAMLLLSGFMDLLDGAVARSTNLVSSKGAFLDSTLDRLGEVFVFAGLLAGPDGDDLVILLALALSMMVSYVRARGEALGVKVVGIGVGERGERLLALGLLSLLGYVYIGVIVVLILASITFVHRFVHVFPRIPPARNF